MASQCQFTRQTTTITTNANFLQSESALFNQSFHYAHQSAIPILQCVGYMIQIANITDWLHSHSTNSQTSLLDSSTQLIINYLILKHSIHLDAVYGNALRLATCSKLTSAYCRFIQYSSQHTALIADTPIFQLRTTYKLVYT